MKSRTKLVIILLSIIAGGLLVLYIALLLMQDNGEEGSSFIREFLPFGSPADNTPDDFTSPPSTDFGSENENGQNTINTAINPTQLTTSASTAGFLYTTTENDAEVMYMRYIDREEGLIYDINIQTGERGVVSENIIADVEQAIWINQRIAGIQKDDGSLWLININEVEREISSTFIDENVEEVISHQSGLAYLQGQVITQINSSGVKSTLATLPITGWSITSTGNILYIYPKSSSGIISPLYRVTTSGLVKETEESGLVAQAGPGGIQISTNTTLRDTTIRTIADKCAVGVEFTYCGVPTSIPEGSYPDDWYKGVVSFTDSIWVVDNSSNGTENIGALPIIDSYKMKFWENAGRITFINKKDGTLWMYTLPEARAIEDEGGALPPSLPVN